MNGREDKKHQVAPLVGDEVRTIVHDVARYLRVPDGEAAHRILIASINDVRVINRLGPYFWRDLYRGQLGWVGHRNNDDLDTLIAPRGIPLDPLFMRLTRDEWSELSDLSHALAKPVKHAAAALLIFATRDLQVVRSAAPGFEPRSPYSLREGTYQWR